MKSATKNTSLSLKVDRVLSGGINRRSLIKAASLLGASVITGPLLSKVTDSLEANAASGDNVFIVGSGAPAISLDPGTILDGQSILLWRGVYENLVVYREDGIEVAPQLAESFEISDDSRTYTFHLRKNVKFHDGEPFNAEAAKLNIERLRSMKAGMGYAFENVELEAPDEHTFIIRLKQPQETFIATLAGMWSPYMVSPKAIRENEKNGDWAAEWLRSNMVGTGPYKLKSYEKDQQATLERFDDYWGGWEGEHFDGVIVRYITDPSTLQLVLQSKQISAALWLPDDALNAVESTPGLKLGEYPSFAATFLILPCAKGPTADKRVRQAIAYAFNYDAWVNDINSGRVIRARGPVAEGLPSFSTETPQFTFNPEKAKALLAEAGYADKGFSLDYIYETGYAWKREVALLLQDNLNAFKISLNIREVSPAAFFDILQNPESPPTAYGFVTFGSLMPRSYEEMQPLFGSAARGKNGANWSYYSNREVDDLLDRAVGELDEGKRLALYREAERLLVEDAPALFLHYQKYRVPMVENVEGYISNPMYIYTFPFYKMHFKQ